MKPRATVYAKFLLIVVTTIPIGGVFWIIVFSDKTLPDIVADPSYWVSVFWIFLITIVGFWVLERGGHLSERWY